MAYDKFKAMLTREEFYVNWSPDQLEDMDEDTRKLVYDKYLLKCLVFQRDNFKCANEKCKYPKSPLTLHHIKFQKNDGKDSVRNCATICKTCHNGYHKGKNPLKLNGRTYKIHKDPRIDWKKKKADNKKFRKTLKEEHGFVISWEMLKILFRFLELELNLEDD